MLLLLFVLFVVTLLCLVSRIDAANNQMACPPRSPLPAGNTLLTMVVDGEEREFTVHVPREVASNYSVPVPLLFDIHGLTSTMEAQARSTGSRNLADEEGFVVVHPQGLLRNWNAGDCCAFANETKDDVKFFREMIRVISSDYVCVDASRVYSMGMSNGGFMSQKLACEAGDLIAAIAPVAGVISFPCNATRQVPYLETHGTADLLVPYEGSPADVLGFESVQTSLDFWLDHNNCNPNVFRTSEPRDDTECVEYLECDLGPAAKLCTVTDGSHVWPDFATEVNWDFLSQFQLQ